MARNEMYALMFGEERADDGSPYTAEIGGHSWSRGPRATFATLRECRDFAESYGTTADWCTVTGSDGQRYAEYRRVGGCEWCAVSV